MTAPAAPATPSLAPPPARVGLVLAGGAARGAYEVGVVQYILEDVARALGRDVPVDVLSGTSAGSINSVMLAAHADKPRARGAMLANKWTSLGLTDVVRPSPGEFLRLFGGLFGRAGNPDARPGRRGGIFDPSGVEEIVKSAVHFPDIRENMKKGHLSAVSISTTHIASGRTIIWVQRARARPAALGTRPHHGRQGDRDDGRARARVGRGPAALPCRGYRRRVLLRRGSPAERASVAGAPPRRQQPRGHQPALHTRRVTLAREGRGAREEVPRPALRFRQGHERAPARPHRERHRSTRAPERRPRRRHAELRPRLRGAAQP